MHDVDNVKARHNVFNACHLLFDRKTSSSLSHLNAFTRVFGSSREPHTSSSLNLMRCTSSRTGARIPRSVSMTLSMPKTGGGWCEGRFSGFQKMSLSSRRAGKRLMATDETSISIKTKDAMKQHSGHALIEGIDADVDAERGQKDATLFGESEEQVGGVSRIELVMMSKHGTPGCMRD